MNDREKALAAGVIAAETVPAAPRVRRLSAASVLMLEMIGNPLSGLLSEVEPASAYHVAEYCWLHSAPLEDVRRQVLAHELAPHKTREAVLIWAEQFSEADLVRMVPEVRGEVAAAGDALVAVEDGKPGGNGHGRC